VGALLGNHCGACGAVFTQDDRFCIQCGAPRRGRAQPDGQERIRGRRIPDPPLSGYLPPLAATTTLSPADVPGISSGEAHLGRVSVGEGTESAAGASSSAAIPSTRVGSTSRRRVIVAAVVVAGLVVLAVGLLITMPSAAAPQRNVGQDVPVLSVRVEQSSIVVWGASFPGSTQVTFYLDNTTGQQLGTAATEGNGNLGVTALPLPASAKTGTHQVRACWAIQNTFRCPVGVAFGS
jgi:hypothetical protein